MNTKQFIQRLVELAFNADFNVQYNKNIRIVRFGTGEDLGVVSNVYLSDTTKNGEIIITIKEQ